jgi:hypothetical protein
MTCTTLASTALVTETPEEDDTIMLKKSDLRQMLHDAMEEFMKRRRGNIALWPATPQGDTQG